jgi:nucleotide-binding universal stress UspA family protein
MPKPILVGYDPRTPDVAPVEFGIVVARVTGAPLLIALVEAGRSPVVALSVDQSLPYGIVQRDDDLAADSSAALAQVRDDLEGRGVKADFIRLSSTSAARALHAAAEDAGLLVVGSSRNADRGRARPGSTAERLLSGAPCPVALVPWGWTGDVLRIVGVAFVDTEEGRAALDGAVVLARRAGATLRVITALRDDADALRDQGRLEGEVHDLVGDAVVVDVVARVGDPVAVLVEMSADLDVLVCGSRGYGPLRAALLGSVSRRVAGAAQCPVIVVPRGVRTPLESLVAEAAAAGSGPAS